jgi:hypothetical protein
MKLRPAQMACTGMAKLFWPCRDAARDPEADVRVEFHELAGVLLTPQGTMQVEAAMDRCDTWECVDELVTIIGSHLR